MSLEREKLLEQAIAKLPRLAFAQRPTPLEPLARLSTALGGPTIYIKRDDLTGLAFGGNKARMLEFSLADAQAKGAQVIVSGAAVQSNYCRQLAAACAKLGLELHLFLRPEREIDRTEIQGNHFLQRLFGAQVTILPSNDRTAHRTALQEHVAQLQHQGKIVYWPRQADTMDLDVIAYAEVALEIVRQSRALKLNFTDLYVSAWDTTQSGLVLGLGYLRSPIQIHGISPIGNANDNMETRVRIANQAARRLGLDIQVDAGDFNVDESFVGERYGIPTPAGIAAIHQMATCEGILLDPVYTGKAMAALTSHVRSGQLDKEAKVLFVHTGGAPALFAYVPDVLGQTQP